MKPLPILATLAACGLLTGCAPKTETQVRLTEHQRDSVLSKSDLPGASVVGRAMDLEGTAAQHSAQLDSIPNP